MDRLTIPREQKNVDAGNCLPAGDSLPSWSTLPMDAKFPMVPTPKGTLTFHTTKYCTPKYRRMSTSDFDLTDPNGMSMSSEYHPLHDPHLKAHFNLPWMRSHLVRNGFITESGMVICSLKEFNKYRQYLRRLYLMELMRERKRENQKNVQNSRRMSYRSNEDIPTMSARFVEVRRRQLEKIEKQRLKQAMMAKMQGEQMERKKQEQMDRQAEFMKKRQEEEERRRETLVRNAKEMERRNLSLLRKWRRRDRQHNTRMEGIRRQRVQDLQKRNKESWENRKRVQRDRIDRETEARERLREEKDRGISERERYLMRQRERQMRKLDRLKSSARHAHAERERICTARLAVRIAAMTRREERRYRGKRSPFRSEWTLHQVLRRLTFGDLTGESSHQFMQMLGAAFDQAVDRVTSQSDDYDDSESHEDREMRRFASDLVESVVNKVRNEIYPAYLRLLRLAGEEDKEDYSDMYDQHFEQSDNGTDDELVFSNQTSDENAYSDNQRSVRFSFDESIIPVSMDSLEVLGAAGLKPVSEHMLTPVPSPIPGDGSCSEFDFRVPSPSKPTKRDSRLTETLLLRLLDDLNHGRLKHEDLLKLTGYCIDVVKVKEALEQRDRAEAKNSLVADQLVNFTISKILSDIKSGSLSEDDLTSLTQSIVKDAQSDLDVTEEDLDRYVSSALSSAMDYQDDDDDQNLSDWMLEDFVSRTLNQVKDDMEQKRFTEEELKEMAAAIVASGLENVAQDETLFAEESMKQTLQKVLEDAEANKLSGAVTDKVVTAIVSTYHTLTSKDQKSCSEMVEEFVTEVLSNVKEGIKAGEYSDDELKQMVSAKLSAKEEADVNSKVQRLIDSLLNQIEGGRLNEAEMAEIGNVLVDTGRKLLNAGGVSTKTDNNVDPAAMTSTEFTDKVVREVIVNIKGKMKDQTFEKEALKALAASFLKFRSSSTEGLSNVPTVDSRTITSYFSTLNLVSLSESSLATDVVLAAMEKITRDLEDKNIPVHMLSSIASSLAPTCDVTPTIFISGEGFNTIQSASLPQHVRMTLTDITQLLKGNRVCYDDAKRIFGIILQTYLCRDASARQGFNELSEDDCRLIETLISETIDNVIRNVTSDLSSLRVATGDSKTGMALSKLSSVMTENDLEKYVWDTLQRIGQDGVDSFLSRPPASVQFPSHSSADSLNVETLVRETLIQLARDISESISCDSSLVNANRDFGSPFLSAGQLSSKIVGLVSSVLEELIIGLESGMVSRASIAQFMEDVCPGRDFKAMEAETLHRQLIMVIDDVILKKRASVHFIAIAETFSKIQRKGKQTHAVMTPELQTIGSILSAIDANILTQFVQATLVTFLGWVQTEGLMLEQVKPGSITSLVTVESAVIARKVVATVIQRIENDISQGTIDFNDMVRKDSCFAACYVDQLMCELRNDVAGGKLPAEQLKAQIQKKLQSSTSSAPPHTQEPSKVDVDRARSSLSGKFSAYVLQTLQAVVSDLGSMSESGFISGTESVSRESSTLLDEFIHKQLKKTVKILPKLQVSKDKSATPKTSSPKAGNTPPVKPSGFMSEVMHEVVDEMLVETLAQSEEQNETASLKAKSSDPLDSSSSSEVAKYVLATLKHALSTEVFFSSCLLAKDSGCETKSASDPSTEAVMKKSELLSKKADVLSKKSDSGVFSKKSEVLSTNSESEEISKRSVVKVEVTANTPEASETSIDPFQERKDASGAFQEPVEIPDSERQTDLNVLVAEVINQAILNIKDGKMSDANLKSLVKSLSKKDVQGDAREFQLVDVLESVKGDILGGAVKTDNIEHVAQEIAFVSMDKDLDKKPPSKTNVDSDSNTSVQSMVKEVLSHIVVSLSEGSQAEKATGTIEDIASDNNTNKNVSPVNASVSPGVISNLAKMSIKNDSPTGLAVEGPKLRNSFRSLVNPDERDVAVEPSNSAALMEQFSDTSNVSDIITNTKPNTASTKSVIEDQKRPSTRRSSDVSISSGDSCRSEKIVRETLPKDTVSLKSSSSDQRQKAPRKAKTVEFAQNRKTGSKSKDGIRKTTAEGSSKSLVPAIQMDSCNSASNTRSRVRMSSSSCTSSGSGSKQDAKSKKTAKKQETKNVTDNKVKERVDDARSTGSEASQTSQVDVMQIRSVCGSHTTEIRVRESQSDSSKE